MNTADMSGLLSPIMQRANADFSRNLKGFSDRSAAFVLKRLGLDQQDLQFESNDEHQHKDRGIERCAWIDRQLIKLLELHPDSEGIEICGGLSTRFHRLSDSLDWPSFAWTAVNTPEVTHLLHVIFPPIDNYKNLSSRSPLTQWSRYINRDEEQTLVIIAGEHAAFEHWDDFLPLYDSIKSYMASANSGIDLILTHRIPHFLSRLGEEQNAAFNLKGMFTEDLARGSKLSRFIQRLSACSSNSHNETLHLRLN